MGNFIADLAVESEGVKRLLARYQEALQIRMAPHIETKGNFDFWLLNEALKGELKSEDYDTPFCAHEELGDISAFPLKYGGIWKCAEQKIDVLVYNSLQEPTIRWFDVENHFDKIKALTDQKLPENIRLLAQFKPNQPNRSQYYLIPKIELDKFCIVDPGVGEIPEEVIQLLENIINRKLTT